LGWRTKGLLVDDAQRLDDLHRSRGCGRNQPVTVVLGVRHRALPLVRGNPDSTIKGASKPVNGNR
jgi:hypothetical protein